MNSSIVDPTLHQSLRALRLSGMLDTLDARLAQARGGELGHLDFLQVLCDDEITRREAHAIARRVRRAHFDEQATLEEFDFTASPKLPAVQIRDLAALRWLQAGESVILFGRSALGRAMSPPRSNDVTGALQQSTNDIATELGRRAGPGTSHGWPGL